ncbi:MAG: cation tolerance protein CutA [Candidatus Aminicenantes bacterium RBG_16_63_16]|nr:MAG: cation tolerance protein CutA [Candidatus Aminicenantes bacterium RBG_16_63_16]
MGEFRLVLTTVPDEELGRRIARTLVEERLAACVNVSPAVLSFYWWDKKLVEDREFILLVKTKASILERLEARLKELHPYQVPEFIALPIDSGSPEFLGWLDAETRD